MDLKYFQTTSQDFAAYLCHENFDCLGTIDQPTDEFPNQKAFILLDDDKRPKLEEEWRTGRATVNAVRYAKMLRMLQRKKREPFRAN